MTTRDASPWMYTYTGVQFTPLSPDPAQIRIEDIAHALAGINRYNGHTRHYITVAQHSLLVSHQVPECDALWGLLHDASEAYLGDCISPLKHHTDYGKAYQAHEARLQAAICERFGLPVQCPASVLRADHAQLQEEFKYLLDPAKRADRSLQVNTMPPLQAELEFLNRFRELTR